MARSSSESANGKAVKNKPTPGSANTCCQFSGAGQLPDTPLKTSNKELAKSSSWEVVRIPSLSEWDTRAHHARAAHAEVRVAMERVPDLRAAALK